MAVILETCITALGIAVGVFAAYLLAVAVYRLRIHPLSKYPGPFLAKLSNSFMLYYFVKGDSQVHQRLLHEKYGPVVRVGPNRLIFRSPSALKTIYTSHHFQKAAGYLATSTIPGSTNVFSTVNKDLHRFKRKSVSPAFSEHFIKSFEPVILEHVDIFIQQLLPRPNEPSVKGWSVPRNISDHCKRLTIDIMAAFGFGQSFKLQTEATNRGVMSGLRQAVINGGIYYQFPESKMLPLDKYMKTNDGWTQAQYGKFVQDMIQKRIDMDQNAKPDMFSFVTANKEVEAGYHFSLQDIWSESRLFLIAGSDTSSTVLSSLFFYLSRYPACHRTLETELRQTFDSAESIRLGPKLTGCHYLHAAIDEALRLSPPAGNALWREAIDSGEVVDGVFVPAGIEVGVSLYSLFHCEDVYPQADSFVPERWLETNGRFPDRLRDAKAAFKPFSLGSRNCVGMNLARAEMSMLVAKSIWSLEFVRPDSAQDQVGQGSIEQGPGRQDEKEFQLHTYIVSLHDGPYLQFRERQSSS